jgi:hypothetical protein
MSAVIDAPPPIAVLPVGHVAVAVHEVAGEVTSAAATSS